MPVKIKRKRGGQEGNRNARKHGFYAARFSDAEISVLSDTVNRDGLDPEIAAIRIRLTSALSYAPGNRRVLREASRRLAELYRRKYHLDENEYKDFKKFVRRILESAAAGTADFDGTNPAYDGETALKMTERIQPATVKRC
ncbi:MAG: hypothetical protein JXA51_03050 [Dehalococcoidales bacterium]|nr:hypothetical protein [Dehalococcoidales bacterium]